MDATQLAGVKAEVGAAVDLVGNLAGIMAPEFLPFIVLGKAIAKQFPDLINDAINAINGQEPTDADDKTLAGKIAALGDPASL